MKDSFKAAQHLKVPEVFDHPQAVSNFSEAYQEM